MVPQTKAGGAARHFVKEKRGHTRKTGTRPEGVSNHWARAFAAVTPKTKWVTDITYLPAAEEWLYRGRRPGFILAADHGGQ